MDNHNRYWYYSGSRLDVATLNVVQTLTTIIAYVINEVFLKPNSDSLILHGYLNDFLAMVLLLAIANLLMALFAPLPIWRTPWIFLAVATFAALYWEFVTPLYFKSTTDPLDFIAYALGAVCFLFVTSKARKIQPSIESL